MNLANKLTILRVLMIPVFLVFLLGDITQSSRYIAIFIFILASLTDALDGHIARSRNLITNFGKFMDPVADKLLVSSALIAMVELNIISSWVVIVIISRDFILMTFRMVASTNNIVISADKMGKVKTVAQMIMTIYLMFNFASPIAILIGNVLIALVIFLTVASALSYIIKNISVIK